MNFIKKIRNKIKDKIRYCKKKRLLEEYKKNNNISIFVEDLQRVSLKIEGQGNTVVVGKLREGGGIINLNIVGNNNALTIGEGCYVSKCLSIHMGQNHCNFGLIENTKCSIGKNCSFEGCNIKTFNSNANIDIGDRCMVSYNVNLYHTDGHPIMDYETRKIINKVKNMNIGDHVWLGANSTILKNSSIPNNSIVGWGSVVSGKYYTQDEGGVVLAGNPSKVVKQGIIWDANGNNGYVQNIF